MVPAVASLPSLNSSMPPQDRGLDGRTMPGEATFAVPGEMSLALDLLLLPLCVLLTRLAGRHDAARRELLARLVERLGREGIALASSAG